jgi:hypothetical protein
VTCRKSPTWESPGRFENYKANLEQQIRRVDASTQRATLSGSRSEGWGRQSNEAFSILAGVQRAAGPLTPMGAAVGLGSPSEAGQAMTSRVAPKLRFPAVRSMEFEGDVEAAFRERLILSGADSSVDT